MKKMILLLVLTLSFGFAGAQEQPEAASQWMRYPALSPDGNQIAFCYQGNIYLVSAQGGMARPLTMGEYYNYKPVWSPDGQQIAFASDRHGNFDLFLMPAMGGPAKRLTHHSANDYPEAFAADGKSVLFTSGRLMNPENSQFPYGRFNQLYQVSLDGNRPELLLPLPLEDMQSDKTGQRWLYIDLKGYEDIWRKHHTSSVTRDVWLFDRKAGTHTQLTTFEGEDRNPVWAANEQAVYYLSEASGSFNVWKMDVGNPAQPQQITALERHPVRFLSVADGGLLCFGYHGGIYTMEEGGQPVKLGIQLPYDQPEPVRLEKITSEATEMALSPNGKELAFVVRGEVFVTGVESGLTKRITNTPEQERSVSFSPDGRKLLYAGERNQSWNLYECELAQADEAYFYAATALKERALLETPAEAFQPAYSPDGKEVAYLEERTELKVLNLATKAVRSVLPGDKNYSYSDGDQHFRWSPDSKWFLVSFLDRGRWVPEAGLVHASGKQEVVNLSNSGYAEGQLEWGWKGKAALFTSDREGFRSHGSWGSQTDVYAMFFDEEAYARFKLSKDEFAILQEAEKKAKEKEKDGKKQEGEAEEEAVEDLALAIAGIEDRVERLTLSSALNYGFALSPDGETLYYLTGRDNSMDLWELKIREKSVKTLANFKGSGGSLALDEEGAYLYVLSGGNISRVKTEDGTQKPVSFTAELYLDQAGERDYLFEHIWRQVDKKFYVEDLHGTDWAGLKKDYAPFLPHIGNSRDFAEMASELLGELNGSHTGCRYMHKDPKGDQTAALGLFEDYSYEGAGIKIAEIMDKSPFRLGKTEVEAGMVIEAIDGVAIGAKENYYPLLNHKAGKPVLLRLFNPEDGSRRELRVKAISLGEQGNLLYERWVKSRRAETERLSEGRLGYVHVRGMNSPSFREVFSELLGRYSDKEAVIVDTRFNGGGWLHDDLATLLSGEQYVKLVPRGQVVGSEPQNKWQRPSVVLVGEGNYSDAHFFPVAYRELGIGEIVGMPVPGTTTAVWWERQIDPSLVFGIPQVGVIDREGRYLENQQLLPDHQVKNLPGGLIDGRDAQLEKAVELLLGKD